MSTPTPAAPKAPTPAAPKAGPPKSIVVNLVGNSPLERLRFQGTVRKDGTVTCYAMHSLRNEEGKTVKSTRGASTEKSSLEDARKWIDTAVASAIKAGWQKRAGGIGATKPDSFDLNSLPVPAKG